ncbi:hypothetical protein [Melghiribacillus thermohalophilus]|uniref:hypothetical protein n=1 Tax=Melghiribacillus thermohalophilus TaxID=1324956 RepID=UPI003C7610CC
MQNGGGTIRNSYSEGVVDTGDSSDSTVAGGIVGAIYDDGGVVENNYALGKVRAVNYAAGIVGQTMGGLFRSCKGKYLLSSVFGLQRMTFIIDIYFSLCYLQTNL